MFEKLLEELVYINDFLNVNKISLTHSFLSFNFLATFQNKLIYFMSVYWHILRRT